MTAPPIVERELRVASRRPVTWWLRVTAAVLGLLMAAVLFHVNRNAPAYQGRSIMIGLSILLQGLALLSGCFLTADCVSSERREGTLGLLFLTPLQSIDIVLGKLVSAAVNMVYGLSAVLPILFLTLLIGGVPVGEAVRVSVAILSTMLLSLALGLFLSTFTNDSTRAAMGTLILLGVLTFLPLMLLLLIHEFVDSSARIDGDGYLPLTCVSPFFAMTKALDATGAGFHFLAHVLTQAGLAGLLLVAGAFRLSRNWRTFLDPAPSRPREIRAKARRRTSAAASPWQRLIEQQVHHPGWARWFNRFLWLILLLACVAMTLLEDPEEDIFFGIPFCVLAALHLANGFLFLLEASRVAHAPVHDGALEQIMVTPLPESDLIRGYVRGINRALRSTRLLPSLANGFYAVCLIVNWKKMGLDGEQAGFLSAWLIGGALVSWINFHALTWAGLLHGITSRTPLRAAMMTLLRVHLLPWISFFLLFVLLTGTNNIEIVTAGFWLYYLLAGSYALLVLLAVRRRIRRFYHRLVVDASG